VLQNDSIRWGICHLKGGVGFTATDTDAFTNGEYKPKDKAAELIFKAGGDDRLYDDGRDIAYVQTHEIGHAIRDQILEKGTDERSIELITQLDGLYKQHLSMGLEEYRTLHSDKIVGNLDKLLEQFQALDSTIAPEGTKQQLKAATDYIKTKLDTVDGLTELALHEADDDRYPGHKSISLSSLNGMIATASIATSPEDHALYGVNEFIEDYPDKLDRNLIINTENALKDFLKPRFLSEDIMPGNDGGHSEDNNDESFATEYILTGLVSPNHYPEITGRMPEQYRAIGEQELHVMHELRSGLDPHTFDAK
jgi:hypothetical protein